MREKLRHWKIKQKEEEFITTQPLQEIPQIEMRGY